MKEQQTSTLEHGLIWFGAGISIAEIITGTYFAPLGFAKGILAIILGHVIGCILFFAAGLIGGFTRKSSMETVKMSFGQKGGRFFALLNIIQLAGWTAIMIYDGALAANGVFSVAHWFWCFVIGALIVLWLVIGIKHLGKLNVVAMTALFFLTVILSFIIFRGDNVAPVTSNTLTFGAAVELSVAMPLSWLPLISDYTRDAKHPVKATAVSSIVYGIVSCWMYIIGMGAAIFTGESDISQIILKAGLGLAGLLIVILSTVTTTFLDAYSAGVSGESLSNRINGKHLAVITTILGTILAICYSMTDITDFLYFIGSVFAPMIAIQITDYFFLKKDSSQKSIHTKNFVIWLVGFLLYRLLMTFDIVIGCTLPDMIITMLLCLFVAKQKPEGTAR